MQLFIVAQLEPDAALITDACAGAGPGPGCCWQPGCGVGGVGPGGEWFSEEVRGSVCGWSRGCREGQHLSGPLEPLAAIAAMRL